MSFIKCKGCGREMNVNSGMYSTKRKLCRDYHDNCERKFWKWWDSVKNNPEYNHLIYNTETRRVNYWRDNIRINGGS